jgi:glycogen synthase
MNVLMTVDAVGGVWSYALLLSRALAQRGVQVHLATMGPRPSPDQREEAVSVPGLRLHESDYPLEWMLGHWRGAAASGAWLLDLATQTRPHVIHLNGYAHACLPWKRPTLVVGHSCVLSWWEAVRGQPAPPACNRYRHEVARGLRAADLVVAPTLAMLMALQRQYGPLLRTQVIANGSTPPRPSLADRLPDGPRTRNSHSGGNGTVRKEPFVLTAGRLWDEAKNAVLLDEVAPGLPWPALAAGPYQSVDGSVPSLPNLRLTGALPRGAVRELLERAAIYALPARYEPFGLGVLEAAGAGCALLLGDISSLRENWRGAAVFVPPDDAQALRHALSALIRDPGLRLRLGTAARERAARFTASRMADRYLRAYEDLLEKAVPCAS